VSITATPTLTVAGAPVAGALAVTGAAALVAVDELRVTWGRASVLEQPQAATASLTVLDRGRITDVAATPRPGGGFRVALSASSVEVDLANYVQPQGTTWPAETLGARKTRIAALIPAGMIAGGLNLPSPADLGMQYATAPGAGMDALTAAAVDVSGRSVLELIRELYASWSPLAPVYDPAGDRFTFPPRRIYAWSNIGWTASALAVADPDHGGRYVPASLTGLHLDGGRTAYSGSLAQRIDSRITRVEVGYLDSSAAYARRTRSWGTSNIGAESAIGRRVLSVDTVRSTVADADQLASFYADVASVEARTPRLAAVGWHSDREPLHSAAHASLLLAGSEQSPAVFLGATWLPALAQRPLVAILGGTVAYGDGAWRCDLTPGPTAVNPAPFAWAPITPAACNPAVRAADCDPSLTFGDAAFLDVGIGYTLTTAHGYKGNPS
jgi:hypothetical protein